MRQLDYTQFVGNKYGRLEVIGLGSFGKEGLSEKRQYLLCLCECGIPCYVEYRSLKYEHTLSCGCLHKESIGHRAKGKPAATRLAFGESHLRAIFDGYQRNAQKRFREFLLTFDQFQYFVSLPCHYCGNPPILKAKKGNYYGSLPNNGLDRIKNDIGYVVENIVPCCTSCNYAKRDLTYEDFISWLDQIVKFRT